MAKRKCKFADEMKAKHPCFRKGRNEWEAKCLVCKPGTDVYFLSLPCSLLCNNSALFSSSYFLLFAETTVIALSKMQQILLFSFCSVFILLSRKGDGGNVLWMQPEFKP